jgi:hypothetical protein
MEIVSSKSLVVNADGRMEYCSNVLFCSSVSVEEAEMV